MKKWLHLPLVLLLVAGCSKSNPASPNTDPTATPVPQQTATPMPSQSATPVPTAAPTSIPTEPLNVYIYNATASPTTSEQVTLKNNSGVIKDLSNWKLGDTNSPSAYNIPSGTILNQGQTHSFPHTTLNFQINDAGETLYLHDSSGNLIDTWSN